jgi:hypothetical protein
MIPMSSLLRVSLLLPIVVTITFPMLMSIPLYKLRNGEVPICDLLENLIL